MDVVWKKAFELEAAREPFAIVTVVRSEKPTSALPGAKAIINSTGKMFGFVGGQCTQSQVVSEALQCIETGKSKLVLISPDMEQQDRNRGITVLPMTCQSGGTVELFIEPKLPRRPLVVIGDSPIAKAISQLAQHMEEFQVHHLYMDDDSPEKFKKNLQEILTPRAYVVVATMGLYDELSITALQDIELAYLGLIASPKRKNKVMEYLQAEGASEEFCSFISAPAGLDLGAIYPTEIAITVLAEIIQHKNSQDHQGVRLKLFEQAKREVIDPVCQMVVDLNKTKYKAEYQGVEYGFCCPNCRRRFLENPEAYLQKV